MGSDTIEIAAVTDEFSSDVQVALRGMRTVGMTGAELRVVGGKNIIECTDEEVDAIRAMVEEAGLRIISIASPVLKCVLPGGENIDTRLDHDVFGSSYTFEDQPRLASRALSIAERCGASIVRVFSGWRTVTPEACLDATVSVITELADRAAARGLTIGIENEFACNVGTGAEARRLLDATDHAAIKIIWDPANALILGEQPYPEGYAQLPVERILHVHAKDCRVRDFVPTWGPFGEMEIDWAGQLRALRRDGYRGFISLETHWRGPKGDKFEASLICGRKLRELVESSRSS